MLEGGKSQVRNGSKDGESGERRRSNDRRSEYMMRSKKRVPRTRDFWMETGLKTRDDGIKER